MLKKRHSWGPLPSTVAKSEVIDNFLAKLAVVDPRTAPNEPIGQTGISLNEIKRRVNEALSMAPDVINPRAKAAAEKYITSYVLNSIGINDKAVNIYDYVDTFTTQYIRDKYTSKDTGVEMRSPIRTKRWLDHYLTPKPEDIEQKDSLNTEDVIMRIAKEKEEKKDWVYVGLDGDKIGSLVEESLLKDDPELSKEISDRIHRAHEEIRKAVKEIDGKIIFDGGDNVLIYMPYDEEVIRGFWDSYVKNTNHTITVGIGKRPIEAHLSLVWGKNHNGNKITIWSEELRPEIEQIKKEQKEMEQKEKGLKYKV